MKTEIILGLDICKSSAVACVLFGGKPSDIRKFYRDGEFFSLACDRSGLDFLDRIDPTVAILEPTGMHYARFWLHHLSARGCEIRMVHNSRLPSFRRELDLPDKDDEADALALACYYATYRDNPARFLDLKDAVTARVRELSLELAHLNRCQSPVINKFRQRLAWQWPEVAHRQLKSQSEGLPPLLIGFIAGDRKSKKLDRELATSTGIGLDDASRFSASQLVAIHHREHQIERELRALIYHPQFAPYRRAMAKFGFGERVLAILLAQVFPVERLFDRETGKPETYRKRNKKTGKVATHRLSERRFKKLLGCASEREWSGDEKSKSRKTGSSLCRSSLWQWVFCRIEVRHSRSVKSDEFEQLCRLYESLKASKLGGKKVRMRVASKACELLFRAICQELQVEKTPGDPGGT